MYGGYIRVVMGVANMDGCVGVAGCVDIAGFTDITVLKKHCLDVFYN